MHNRSSEKWLLYSTSDEDSHSELRALDIRENDNILSVTGSGCRSLSLLTHNPKRLTTIDYSPGQSYLFELKLAAFRRFSYEDLLSFLGIEACDDRWAMFETLKPDMSTGAIRYFTTFNQAIRSGVLFSGRHEQFYKRYVSPIMSLLFGKALTQLSRCNSLEEQRDIFRTQLNGRIWRALIRKGFSERALRKVFNDQNYEIEIDVPATGDYMLGRLEHTFMHHLMTENHWSSFMLLAKYPTRKCLPHFLKEENYAAIRNATTEVSVVTDDLRQYLAQLPSHSVDKFSLSDVTSCISRASFNNILLEVQRIGIPGGRLCYRNFLAKYSVSKCEGFTRDDDICVALDHDDLAFAYSFEVATIANKQLFTVPHEFQSDVQWASRSSSN